MTPKHIDDFWQRTLERSAREPLDAQVEKVPERQAFFKYRVTYRGLGGIPVRAYLGVPVENAGRFPVIVTAPGYSGYEFGCELSDCLRGYLILQVYPRGQGESGELWRVPDNCYQAWVNFGKEKPEGFYYQGAFTDVVRGIDYLLSRDDADANRVGLMGTSQGGGIVLSVGGIDSRVKAVVAHVPYLCDLRHSSAILGCPDLVNDLNFFNTFDYFDPVNLATRLRAATLLSSGGKDKTCPAETIRAVFDRLAGIKSLVHYPDLAHTTSVDFYDLAWRWLEKHVKLGQ